MMICLVERFGLLEYSEALSIQQEKVRQRKAGTIPDTLLLLEHPHVYTLGRNAKRTSLLVSPDRLAQLGAELFETDRGGDVTYHGPGQLVGYPVLDLARHRRDIGWYMRSLEEVLIGVAADFGVQAGRLEGCAGVWTGGSGGGRRPEKLAAMGVHVSRWVTSHGFAFNVNTDLSYFGWIIPCGLPDKGVTSLERLLGGPVNLEAIAGRVVAHFGRVFGMEMQVAGETRSHGHDREPACRTSSNQNAPTLMRALAATPRATSELGP